MTKKLIIDWKEYNLIVEKLAIQIHESDYRPTMLIGIMRGGAPIIDVLSRVFKLKCAYLAVESYSGEGTEDQQGELVFSREISSTVLSRCGAGRGRIHHGGFGTVRFAFICWAHRIYVCLHEFWT